MQESGVPVISEAILRMIRESDVFIADVTPVSATRASKGRKSKRCANPNVAFELGYDSARSPRRIILVGNDVYGSLEDGFFDVRDKKQLRYRLCQDCTQDDRKTVQTDLRSRLSQELRRFLGSGNPARTTSTTSTPSGTRIEANVEKTWSCRSRACRSGLICGVSLLDPRLTNSASMMARFMPPAKDKRVLDLGTGCGVLAILAAFGRGPKEVFAVDEDPNAIDNAQENVC